LIYAVLDFFAVDAFCSVLSQQFEGAVVPVEYSIVDESKIESGSTVIFFGSSLFTAARRNLARQAERRLLPGIRVLNSPGRVKPRSPVSSARTAVEVLRHARDADFPLSLRVDHPAGFFESPALYTFAELADTIAEWVMASTRIEDIWAVPMNDFDAGSRSKVYRAGAEIFGCPPQHRDQLQLIFQEARVDVGVVDFAICSGQLKLWRLDDGPAALMPHPEMTSEWLHALAKS
jgi:hypothetical protein